MKVKKHENHLKDSALSAKLMATIGTMTQEFKYILPRGWRFITEIEARSTEVDQALPALLLYLDLQADKGGGSWAEAKIKTMKEWQFDIITRPLEAKELLRVLQGVDLEDALQAKEIWEDITYGNLVSSEKLVKHELDWLVNVAYGPGVAPNFGGLSLRGKRYSFDDDGKPRKEEVTVYVAFSGAEPWQDLQFATLALKRIVEYSRDVADEYFEFDFVPLKKSAPEVRLWLQNYGLVE